jgi:hypothetical protein
VSVHFHTIQGAGHGRGFGGREIEQMVNEFFDRCLKGKTVSGGEAVQTESVASAMPARNTGGVQPGPRLTWEQVSRREGVAADGRVTRQQFKGPPPLFDRLDRNHDGVLSKEDFDDAPPAPRPLQ